MSEDDIRNYLTSKSTALTPRSTKPRMRVRRAPRTPPRQAEPEGYKEFSATHLFCPRCQQATPVRERILLFLPDGDLYDYSCTVCGTSVGTRKAGK